MGKQRIRFGIIALLLLLPLNAHAFGVMVGSCAAGTAGCAGYVGSTLTTPSYNASGGYIFGIQITVSCADDLQKLGFYLAGTDRSSSVALALYSDNSNAPGTMLATTAEFADPDVLGWYDELLTSSYAVTPGKYWIMIWTDTDGSSSQRVSRSDTGSGGFSSYYSAGAINTSAWPAGNLMSVEDRDFGLRGSYDN